MPTTASNPTQATHSALVRLVCQFNLRPDSYIDASWMPQAWPEPWRDPARFGPRGRAALARALSARLGLEGKTCFDFSRDADRLALLPPDALARLAAYCGLVLHRASLEEFAGRRMQRALGEAFGADAMTFLTRRIPPFDAISESIESVRHYPELVVTRVHDRGARLLLDFLAPGGTALGERAQLKFARRVTELPPYLLNAAHRQQVGELIFLCLIPERLGEWDWLF